MNHTLKDKLIPWGKQDIRDMERWEIREFLSCFLFTKNRYQSLLEYNHTNLIKITIPDLINKFEVTITHLLNEIGLPIVRRDFEYIHQEWLAVQKHVNKDQLVEDIVHAVVNEFAFDWSQHQLTVVDEAFVQMRLRDLHNLELKCYNLNEFPVTSSELRKYI